MAFEDFVNQELPLRVSVTTLPVGGNFGAGRALQTTGVGVGVIEVDSLLAAIDIDYFVNGLTGNDITGDGTAGLPWATIQKGIDEASLVTTLTNGTVNVNIAATTYSEILTTPQGASGYLKLIGDTVTPTNVVIDPGSTAIDCFTHKNSTMIVDMDGIRIQQSQNAVVLENAPMFVRFCDHDDVIRGYKMDNRAYLEFIADGDGSTNIDGTAVALGVGILCEGGSTLIVNQSLDVTSFDIGMDISASFAHFKLANTITTNHTISQTNGVIFRDGAVGRIGASITMDGVLAAANTGMLFDNSKVVFDFASNYNLDDYVNGIVLRNGAHVDADGQTFGFTTVTTEVTCDNTSTFNSDDEFDSTVTYVPSATSLGGAEYKVSNRMLMFG